MALTDYPVFGDQPDHFRYEMVQDFGGKLMIWDNDEACMVPGSSYPYADKIEVFRILRRLENGTMKCTWAAYSS